VPPRPIGTINESGERVLLRQGGDAGQPDQMKPHERKKEPSGWDSTPALLFPRGCLDFSGEVGRIKEEKSIDSPKQAQAWGEATKVRSRPSTGAFLWLIETEAHVDVVRGCLASIRMTCSTSGLGRARRGARFMSSSRPVEYDSIFPGERKARPGEEDTVRLDREALEIGTSCHATASISPRTS